MKSHKTFKTYKKSAVALACALPLMASVPAYTFAQSDEGAQEDIENVIVTGTRMTSVACRQTTF